MLVDIIRMRRGIRQLLELDPAFYVVAEAGDGGECDRSGRIAVSPIDPAGSQISEGLVVRYLNARYAGMV